MAAEHCTGRRLRRTSQSRALPNSGRAQLSRCSPAARSGTGGAGTPGWRRQSCRRGYRKTALMGTVAPVGAQRPRPAVRPMWIQLAALRPAPAVDEGLREEGFAAVAPSEVGGEAAQARSEGLGGEVAALRARPVATALGVPADPAVGESQGGGGEDAVPRERQVAQLGTDVAGGASGMLAGDQFGPEPAAAVVGDEFEAQVLDGAGARRHGPRGLDGAAVPAVADGRRESDAVAGVEGPQGLQAGDRLAVSASVVEAEVGAHVRGERGAMGEGLRVQQRSQAEETLRARQRFENAVPGHDPLKAARRPFVEGSVGKTPGGCDRPAAGVSPTARTGPAVCLS